MTTAKDEEVKTLPPATPKEIAQFNTADEKGKDYGEWKYTPWNGLDHWVNEKTNASTFSLKDVR